MREAPHVEKHHGLELKPIAFAAGALALIIVLVAFGVGGLADAWNAPLAGANAPLEMEIAGPALESAPQEARADYFKQKEALLGRYEWIDHDRGIARIPIDAAMNVLAHGQASQDKAGERP